MAIEFLLGGFVMLVGLLFTSFPRQATDLMVAANYVIGSHRGAQMNAQRPWMTRLIGVGFLTFGAVLLALGTRGPAPRQAPTQAWELLAPLAAAGVLAMMGLGALSARRRLTVLAARRLRANGGDIYEGPVADRYAHRLVLLFVAWVLVLAVLVSLVGIALYFRR